MGRNKNTTILNYFDECENNAKCKSCNVVLKGMHAGNMGRHLQIKHIDLFHEMQLTETNISSINIKKPKEIKIKMSAECVKNACIEMITKGGVPFSFLNNSGLRKILQPIYEALPEKNMPNHQNIKEDIKNLSQKIQQQISKDLAQRMVSIKIDSATRMSRNFFAINVQYIENGQLVVKTIGVEELYQRQTGKNNS